MPGAAAKRKVFVPGTALTRLQLSGPHIGFMNAPLHHFPKTATPQIGGQMLALRWAALADAGAISALLAHIVDDDARLPVKAALAALTGWRGQLVDERMAELSVVMEAGLGALLALREDGTDPQAPAAALWREFAEARAAIRQLLETA